MFTNQKFCVYPAVAGALLLLNLNTAIAAQTAARALPDVVFILIDDMGMGDTRVYNPDAQIPTPHMDVLTRTGMVFTDMHSTAALCAPTRYSVMTGNCPFRSRSEWGVWGAFNPPAVLEDQETIGHIMQRAGYNTAMLGKLNNGGLFWNKAGTAYTSNIQDINFSRGFDQGPTQKGFHYAFNLLVGIQAQPYAYFENDRLVGNPAELIVRPAERNGSSRGEGLAMPDYDSRQAGPALCNKALAFIDRHCREQKDRPFFLYLATEAAHGPYTPPDALNDVPVKGASGVSNRGDMVHEADVVIGQVMKKLETEGRLNNTLFIVTSDNGVPGINKDEVERGHINAQGLVRNTPLRGTKMKIWEGGHREPFIARWGDGTRAGSRITPGSASDEMLCLHDLAATLLALTGQSMPKDQHRDSYNFLPVLLGEKQTAPVRDMLFSQSGNTFRGSGLYFWSLRTGPWKLIVTSQAKNAEQAVTQYAGDLELYNLDADIAETNNLAADPKHRQRIRRMAEALFKLRASERSSPVF